MPISPVFLVVESTIVKVTEKDLIRGKFTHVPVITCDLGVVSLICVALLNRSVKK